MVEFDLIAALVAGGIATIVMTAMMTAAAASGMTHMPSMLLVSGTMMTGDRSKAMRIGALMHYVVMGAVVFGVAHSLLFVAFDDDSWWTGVLTGLAHGAIVGVVFMPLMPMMHPRMPRELVGAGVSGGGAVAVDEDGELQVAAPGLLGKNWGGMTPLGILAGHAVYGLVVALVYGWVA